LDSPIISKITPKTTAILLQLSEHLLHKDYILWVDNYYNSEAKATFLKSCNIDCVGTVKAKWKSMTKKLQENKLQKDDALAQLMAQTVSLGWRDEESLTMISAYHAAEVQTVVKKGKKKQKPVFVIHYNQQMRVVDNEDQLLQMYLVQGKNK